MTTTLARLHENFTRFLGAFLPLYSAGADASPDPVVPRVLPLQQSSRSAALYRTCNLLTAEFPELEQLIARYVQEVDCPGNCVNGDTEQFLAWLATRVDLTDEQLDLLVCLQSRCSVEYITVKKRLAQARFAELLERSVEQLPRLLHSSRLMVTLNPAHIWATLETHSLLDDGEPLPAQVLFYAGNDQVEAVVVDPEVYEVLKLLQRRPLSFGTLSRSQTMLSKGQLRQLLGHLVARGIVALG